MTLKGTGLSLFVVLKTLFIYIRLRDKHFKHLLSMSLWLVLIAPLFKQSSLQNGQNPVNFIYYQIYFLSSKS